MCNQKKKNNHEKRLFCKERSPIWGRLMTLAVVFPFWISAAAIAETDFQPLERAMTDEERSRSGVDSLTAQQRQFLNDWLKARYVDETTDAPMDPSKTAITEARAIEVEVERRVAEKLSTRQPSSNTTTANGPFEASLVGDFSGWRGKTVFRLDNGQVWRQRSSSQYRHRGSDKRVTFDKNWMGGWEMTVVSSGKSVLVSKVK